jgi:hypothetical protein
MDRAQYDFPFYHSIELTKAIPKGGHHFYWKAEIENAGLIIRTWFGDNRGTPFDGYAVRTIASHECQDKNPIQEMWRRAMDKIEQQDFIIVNGN